MIHRSARVFAFLSLTLILISGCQHTVRDIGAGVFVNMGNKYMKPWFFASEDLDLMCGMGEGMTGIAFPLGPTMDEMIPMLTLASGTCAEDRAKEAELEYIRAFAANDSASAKDARTVQKRWLAVAAKRHLSGFDAAMRAYGEPNSRGCPRLKTDDDQYAYMFGLLGGIQAIFADLNSGGSAEVPLAILPRVNRALDCLDNNLLWGVPGASGAIIEIMLATAGNDQQQINSGFRKLEHARALGQAKRIRLVDFLTGTLYANQGKDRELKQLIREHVASKKNNPPNESLQLLDHMASRGLRFLSDRLWTEATGHRTPMGKLGTFWDDMTDTGTLDIDDLL